MPQPICWRPLSILGPATEEKAHPVICKTNNLLLGQNEARGFYKGRRGKDYLSPVQDKVWPFCHYHPIPWEKSWGQKFGLCRFFRIFQDKYQQDVNVLNFRQWADDPSWMTETAGTSLNRRFIISCLDGGPRADLIQSLQCHRELPGFPENTKAFLLKRGMCLQTGPYHFLSKRYTGERNPVLWLNSM